MNIRRGHKRDANPLETQPSFRSVQIQRAQQKNLTDIDDADKQQERAKGALDGIAPTLRKEPEQERKSNNNEGSGEEEIPEGKKLQQQIVHGTKYIGTLENQETDFRLQNGYNVSVPCSLFIIYIRAPV